MYCSMKCAAADPGRQNKGGYISEGYRRIAIRDESGRPKYVLEHRHVMQQQFGRPLARFENVHHINGNRLDNRAENLELWVRSQPPGQRAEDKDEWAIAWLHSRGYLITPSGHK